MSRRRSLAGLCLALAAAVPVLGGCSTAPVKSSAGDATQASVPASSTIPPSLAANARADVTTSALCGRDAGGLWVWKGTVTNRSAARHAYTIIVDFTDSTATVEQTKIVSVPPLAPGRTTTWSADGAAGMADIRCVIRSARVS